MQVWKFEKGLEQNGEHAEAASGRCRQKSELPCRGKGTASERQREERKVHGQAGA